MRLPLCQRATEWVCRLPAVIAVLNGKVTWHFTIGKKPKDTIETKTVAQKPSSTFPGRSIGLKEQKITSGVGLRYLYQPGQLEGGCSPATDPVWSLTVIYIM